MEKQKNKAINITKFFSIIIITVTMYCNLSKEELTALQNLCQNEYIVIQKSVSWRPKKELFQGNREPSKWGNWIWKDSFKKSRFLNFAQTRKKKDDVN